jgi:hypothetical protein
LDFGGWTWHLIWHRDRERCIAGLANLAGPMHIHK